MRLRWMLLIMLLFSPARPALAIDFTKEMAPRKWTERLDPLVGDRFLDEVVGHRVMCDGEKDQDDGRAKQLAHRSRL